MAEAYDEKPLRTEDGIDLLLRPYRERAVSESRPDTVRSARAAARLHTLKQRRDAASERYGARTPVLLVHGASASSRTFEYPRGSSIADFLLDFTNLEPWLLDVRNSKRVTEQRLQDGKRLDEKFNFDRVAKCDIPLAVKEIRKHRSPDLPLVIVGHCMGAESLARAIASGSLNGDKLRPERVLLSTIGLFYEVAIDGRLKAEEYILEELRADGSVELIDATCDVVDGQVVLRHEWPDDLNALFKAWPPWFRPHRNANDTAEGNERTTTANRAPESGERPPDAVAEMCNRLSFMYGEPYYEPALLDEIHSSPTELKDQFGPMPLHTYVHASQCVRRRWAAPFDAEPEDRSLVNRDARGCFDDINVVLITGALNRVWHRDSIDRMYEWLQRDERKDRDRYRKVVFTSNGHQDLFWGRNSWSEVFPVIADELTR
jgi:hypothetical protein